MEMVRICDGIPISQDSDKCVWLLDKGVFTVKSLYNALVANQIAVPFKNI